MTVVAAGVHATGCLGGIGSGDRFGYEQAIEFGTEANGLRAVPLGFAGDHAGPTDPGGDLITEFRTDCGNVCGGLVLVEVRLGDLMEGMTPLRHLGVLIRHERALLLRMLLKPCLLANNDSDVTDACQCLEYGGCGGPFGVDDQDACLCIECRRATQVLVST